MPVIGCYDMHLYCDAQPPRKKCGWQYSTVQGGYTGPNAMEMLTGRTEAECLRQARRIGWHITSHRPRKAYCPKCAKP